MNAQSINQSINQQRTVNHQEKKGLLKIESYFSSQEDNEDNLGPPRCGTETGERIKI